MSIPPHNFHNTRDTTAHFGTEKIEFAPNYVKTAGIFGMFASGFLTRGSLGAKRYVVRPAIQNAIVGKALFSRKIADFQFAFLPSKMSER